MKTFGGTRHRAIIACAFVALLTAQSVIQASADQDRLRMMGQCQGCSFKGIDLSDANLMGVNLKEANLDSVNFDGAELRIAIFDYAILENVSFQGADLAGASFRGARLLNVSFEGADLQAAVFEDAQLVETDLMTGVLCNTQMPEEVTDNSECN